MVLQLKWQCESVALVCLLEARTGLNWGTGRAAMTRSSSI